MDLFQSIADMVTPLKSFYNFENGTSSHILTIQINLTEASKENKYLSSS